MSVGVEQDLVLQRTDSVMAIPFLIFSLIHIFRQLFENFDAVRLKVLQYRKSQKLCFIQRLDKR